MMNAYNIKAKYWNRETAENDSILNKLPTHKTSIGNESFANYAWPVV